MSQYVEHLEKNTASLGKRTNYRWVVMGLIFIIWSIAMSDRADLGVALPYITKEFGLSNTEAGAIVSMFFLAYASIQIPSGLIFKKISTRIIFPICMILASVFTFLVGTTSSPLLLKMTRLGLGVAEGPLGIGCTSVINQWFPAHEKGTATGLWAAASKFGPVIVPPICVLILEMYGWREIFYFFAIPGIVLGIAWFFMVANKPSESRFCSPAEVDYINNPQAPISEKVASLTDRKQYSLVWLDKLIRAKKVPQLDTVGKIFCSWNIYGNAIGYGFMIGINNVIMAWIPTYLITVKHITSMKMGVLASAPFMGAVLGNMLGGWVSDRLLNQRRKPLMLLSALSTTFMMYALISAPDSVVYLGVMLFMAGLLLSFGYSAFAVYSMGLTTKETYPVAFSVINCGGQIGGGFAPLVVGMILDAYNWDNVFLFLTVCSILCFLIISTLDEPIDDIANNAKMIA
jgi:ACS family glucarate transporter-like MFS transporter